MASNSGGPGPWGSGGPHSVPPTGNDDEPHGPTGGPRPGGHPGGPWGPGGWRPGGRVPPPPDLDQIITRIQAAIRNLLGRGTPGGSGAGNRGLIFLGVGVILLWLVSGFYRVQPDEQGVVLRFGAFNRTTLPGLNYHLPWPIESAETPAVTRINRIEIGYRSGPSDDDTTDAGRREVPAESLMLTGDENIIDIDLTLLWRIDNAFDYLFDTRDPDVTVKAVAESVLREVMGRTPIQPALGPMRAQIASDVMEQSQRILDSYHTGVQITQVLLQKADPPEAVIESFRDVQRANTDAERLRNEAQAYANDIVPRARGDAARIVAAGQGEKQATIALATGDTKRFLSVLAAYRAAKDITLQRMYLDTMRDILTHAPTVVLDDKVKGLLPYLQVDGVNPPAPPPPVQPPAQSASAASAQPGRQSP